MTSLVESKNIPVKQPTKSRQKVDCFICAEEVPQRRMIKCPFCPFSACSSCVERFLMGIDDDRPRCMDNSCKKVWSFEFLATKYQPSFHNKKYRDRRATLLHEREKSLLPGTQELVRQEKRRHKNDAKIKNLFDENAMCKELMHQNNLKIRELRRDAGIGQVEKKKEKTFTRACPVEDCRGFLSTSLKCGICSGYACKECHLPKA